MDFLAVVKRGAEHFITDKGEMLNIFAKFIGAVNGLLIIFGTSPQMESCFGLIPK